MKEDYTDFCPKEIVKVYTIEFIINNPAPEDVVCHDSPLGRSLKELQLVGAAEVINQRCIDENISEAYEILQRKKVVPTC